MITFKLDDSPALYPLISQELKKFSNWAKLSKSMWIIRSPYSSSKVRDILSKTIDRKGEIIVINITDAAWATHRIDKKITEWMKENV